MSKLKQILKYIKRHKHNSDLHSFKANIENGVAFVSYENESYNVSAFTDAEGFEAKLDYSYNTVDECAEALKLMGIASETIEI